MLRERLLVRSPERILVIRHHLQMMLFCDKPLQVGVLILAFGQPHSSPPPPEASSALAEWVSCSPLDQTQDGFNVQSERLWNEAVFLLFFFKNVSGRSAAAPTFGLS